MGSAEEESSWIFDADGHVVEPALVFEELLPRRHRAFAPRVVPSGDGFRYVCGDRRGFVIDADPESVGAPGETTGRSGAGVARGGSEPLARLADMQTDGIERAALYPTYGLMIQGVTEREPAAALCRAVNDWLADYCRAAPDRLFGVGTLPMTDPDDALREARRCIEELGFCGVWRRPERFPGVAALHDEGHEALWAYLAEADVPLAIHPGLNGVVPYAYFGDRFDEDYASMHAAHFPVEQLMSLTSLIGFGILERHPGLRVALLESGAVWALAHLHRLDEHLETFGFPRAGLTAKPSEIFRRQCFVAVEEPEPGLAAMLDAYPECVVFASDYPHGDCTFPGSTRALLEATDLEEPDRRRLLCENARRLYGFEEGR